MTPDPERAKGWLGLLLPLMQQGGPVLSLALAVMMAVTVWYLLGVIGENRKVSIDLLEKVLRCQESKVELARQCGNQ